MAHLRRRCPPHTSPVSEASSRESPTIHRRIHRRRCRRRTDRRRPEAAVRTLRELAGDSRLILFGHPTLELLLRKMLSFGADDYVVTPVAAAELQQVFGNPPLRLAVSGNETEATQPEGLGTSLSPTAAAEALERLNNADLLLDAMLQHPHDVPAAAVNAMNAQLPEALARLVFAGLARRIPPPEKGSFCSRKGCGIKTRKPARCIC